MLSTLQVIKNQFANNATITGYVGTRCSLVIELQDQEVPYIAYNLKEEKPDTKDGVKELTWVVAIVSDNLTELLTVYDAVKDVIDNEIDNTIMTTFEGSSFPDTMEKDDHYIIELNYIIQTN